MGYYLLRRLLRMLVVLFGVSLIVFSLVRLGGDPVLLMLPPEASDQQVEALRSHLGLDRPLYSQYVSFIRGAVTGDFGQSLQHRRPVSVIVMERLPTTFELSAVAMLVSIAIAVPVGMAAAVRRRTASDGIITSLALLGQSIPVFWTGLLLILLFGEVLGWLPISGWGTWQHMVLPGITLGVWTAPVLVRLMRSSMLEVLNQDYIRTARAKGLLQRYVVNKHALKNAAIPVLTVMGIQFGRLLGGSVITESVFAIPGVGRATVQAIFNSDFPVVQGAVIYLATIVVLLNLFTDLIYAFLNPQIRFD